MCPQIRLANTLEPSAKYLKILKGRLGILFHQLRSEIKSPINLQWNLKSREFKFQCRFAKLNDYNSIRVLSISIWFHWGLPSVSIPRLGENLVKLVSSKTKILFRLNIKLHPGLTHLSQLSYTIGSETSLSNLMSVCRLVGWPDRLVCYNFLKGRIVALLYSYRSTCFPYTYSSSSNLLIHLFHLL